MENQAVEKIQPLSSHQFYYRIWCMQCGYEKAVRGRPIKCPECNNSLHEYRWLH